MCSDHRCTASCEGYGNMEYSDMLTVWTVSRYHQYCKFRKWFRVRKVDNHHVQYVSVSVSPLSVTPPSFLILSPLFCAHSFGLQLVFPFSCRSGLIPNVDIGIHLILLSCFLPPFCAVWYVFYQYFVNTVYVVMGFGSVISLHLSCCFRDSVTN